MAIEMSIKGLLLLWFDLGLLEWRSKVFFYFDLELKCRSKVFLYFDLNLELLPAKSQDLELDFNW